MNAARYLRTVANLRPAQVLHRVRLRSQRAVASRVPALFRPSRAGPRGSWPAGLTPVDALAGDAFPGAEENAKGQFRFLEETRAVADWRQPGASQLWRYHLHYFEWAWAFAAHPDREWARDAFAGLWRAWRDSSAPGQGDAWSPYVVSLRAWAWCGVFGTLVAGSPIEGEWLAELALHRRYLRAFLELDVGGNHLVKNLKALAGLGVFLDDKALVASASRRLQRQLAIQVLPDGGHFERSPSYHCQVLGDLVDVHNLLTAAACPPIDGLAEAIAAMRRWLGVMLMPDGDVPLFNDCARVGRRRLAVLDPTPPEPLPLHILQPSGYAVLRGGDRVHLVADIGPPCPPDLPAHAHADCLSFELALDGERAVVNTGTSTYAPGERRAFERSTAAHNTVEIDGRDQTEVWGVFRAARLAQPVLEHASVDYDCVTLTASHDGYKRLPGRPRHQRTWSVTPGCLEVRDEVTGDPGVVHTVTSRFHRAPGAAVRPVSAPGPATTEPVEVATGFGARRPSEAVVLRTTAELPVVSTIAFE